MDTLWIVYMMALFLGGMPLLMALVGVFDEESLELGAAYSFLAFFKPLAFMLALFFFGLVGAAFRALYDWAWLSVLLGAGCGLVFGVAGERLVSMLRREVADSSLGERGLVGREATVVLALGPERQGKVRCNLGHTTMEVLARPMESGHSFSRGEQVLILEMDKGVALVAHHA